MDRPNERDELLAAWRALAGSSDGPEGWNTIPLALAGRRRLRAGRRFPGNEEALLVGFTGVGVPSAEHLPQGQGFLVSKLQLDIEDRTWLALSRRSGGSLELFVMMALDLIAILVSCRSTQEEQVLSLFLTRIRAWQDFMRRGPATILGPEAEIGLFGELIFLRSIIEAGAQRTIAVEAWLGPLNGTQDFALGTGAVEVKTTISTSGFPATVGSRDQLDDAFRQPLFLAAVRLLIDSSGMSLPAIVEDTRTLLREDPSAFNGFNSKLLHAGFLDTASEQYRRCFAHASTRILRVTNEFPRLIRSNLPPQIIEVRYDLDCDQVDASSVEVRVALGQLGVI